MNRGASQGTFAGDVPWTCRTLPPPQRLEASAVSLRRCAWHNCPQLVKQGTQGLLCHPHTRIRAAAWQLNSKRIRRGTPPPPQGMGGTTSHRRNTHLRQMRTASHGRGPMGPRPHRQQTKLDRPGTQTLQQERRTAQSNRKRRTLDTTPSQATAATTVATNRQTTNANTTRHKRIKHKQTSQTSTHNKNNKTHTKNRKKYNQPTRQHP